MANNGLVTGHHVQLHTALDTSDFTTGIRIPRIASVFSFLRYKRRLKTVHPLNSQSVPWGGGGAKRPKYDADHSLPSNTDA
jgi:hypothetical protein